MKYAICCLFVITAVIVFCANPALAQRFEDHYFEEPYLPEDLESFYFEEEMELIEQNEYIGPEDPENFYFDEKMELLEQDEYIGWEWEYDRYGNRAVFFHPAAGEERELFFDGQEVFDVREVEGGVVFVLLQPEWREEEEIFSVYSAEMDCFVDAWEYVEGFAELQWLFLDDYRYLLEEVRVNFLMVLCSGGGSGFGATDWISKIKGIAPAKKINLNGLGGDQFNPSVWEGKVSGVKQIRILYQERVKGSAGSNLVLYDPLTQKAVTLLSSAADFAYAKIEKDTIVYFQGALGGACDVYRYNIVTTAKTKLLSAVNVHSQPGFGGDYIVYHDGKNIRLYQISKKIHQKFKTDSGNTKYALDVATDGKSVVYSQGVLNTSTYERLWNIYVYSLAAKTTKKITKTSFKASSCASYKLAVDGDLVSALRVWGFGPQIEIIQVSTLKSVILKSSGQQYSSAAVSGNRVSYLVGGQGIVPYTFCVYDFSKKKEVYRRQGKHPNYAEVADLNSNSAAYDRYNGKDMDIAYKSLLCVENTNWLYYMKNDIYPANKGLLSSYDNDKYMAFTYDQALAVIAFCYIADYAAAEEVLSKLQSLVKQNCLTVGHSKYTNYPLHYHRYAGPNAWVVQAVNVYTARTGNKKYQTMAKTLVDWLLTLQEVEGNLTGGYTYNYTKSQYEKAAWSSTEYNLSAYAAVKSFANTFYGSSSATGKAYLAKADKIRKWLETKMWIYDTAAGTNRFIRGLKKKGVNDYDPALDVNSWSILALGKKAQYPVGIGDFSIGLKWAYDNIMTKNDVEGVEGFSFVKYSTYLNAKTPSGKKAGIVWSEGTCGVALAMKRAPITVTAGKNQTYFQGQVKKMSKTTGNRTGVYYTTAPPAGFTAVDPYYPNHNASVAGTAWCIFSECDFNPLGQ